MNPELDRRLADLADAATRATTGIDPVATLAVFRRRRRARVAASTVTAAAAVVGLAFGAAQLGPNAPVGPADTVEWPTADPSLPVGACGSVAESMPVMGSAVWPEMSSDVVSVARGESPDLTVTVTNLGGDDYALWPERTVHVILVRDGVVVGFTSPASQETTAVPQGDELAISDFGPPVLCEAGELVPDGSLEGRASLPEGSYRAWAVTAPVAGDPGSEWTFDLIGSEGSLTVTEGASTPTASPTSTPTSTSAGSLACGLPPDDAFAAITGVPVEAHGSPGSHDMELSLEVDASGLETSRVLSTTSTVAFPGAEPPAGAEPPYTFRVWLLVTGPDGTVVGVTAPWEQPDKERVEDRSTVLERCPDASWAGLRVPELFHVHAATAPVGETPPRHLSLADTRPLFEPDPVQIDGPGSCGRMFFLDGVSESEGALFGLSAELTDVALSSEGEVTGFVVISNNSDAPITGAYVLTRLLVEMHDGPFEGSILTLPEPLELTDVVSIAGGGVTRVELDLAMTSCAEDVVPLPASQYTVSAIVDLLAPGEPLGFSSPAVEVILD